MSNVNSARRVEGDWWAKPDSAERDLRRRILLRDRADFSPHAHHGAAAAVRIGDHVSCYAGCSFALGKNGTCTIGDFTLVNGALIMAEERIEIGSHCLISWNVGIADSDFHPHRTGAAPHRRPGARAILQRPPAASEAAHRARHHCRQRLDRNERDDFERRDDRRKFRRCGRSGGHEERSRQMWWWLEIQRW